MTGALPAGERDEERETEVATKKKKNVGSPAVAVPSEIGRTPSSNASKKSRASKNGAKAAAMETSPAQDAPSQDEESSLLDPSLLSFGSLDSESPAHGTRPPSAMKIGGTPAHETSILALTNFRRRARQPSLLRMVQQTTDVEDNDLDDSDALDDLDDFHPDDESTPLHVRKNAPAEETNQRSAHNLSSSGSRGKKRKLASPVVQVPRSSPPIDSLSGADIAKSLRSSSPSLPEGVIENQEEVVESREQAEPGILSDTMAPPRSSSAPIDEIDDSPARPRQRKKRGESRRKVRGSGSEDEETERPTRMKAKSKSKIKVESISTAKLQALLPRRRTRVAQERDEYDILTSDDIEEAPIDSDQDELQLPTPRKGPKGRKATSKPNKKISRGTKKSAMPTDAARRNTRTYGRHTSSDKENDSAIVMDTNSLEADEPTETTINIPDSKLAAIAKKFEDVDAWEMEFESVDAGGGDSSPWR